MECGFRKKGDEELKFNQSIYNDFVIIKIWKPREIEKGVKGDGKEQRGMNQFERRKVWVC